MLWTPPNGLTSSLTAQIAVTVTKGLRTATAVHDIAVNLATIENSINPIPDILEGKSQELSATVSGSAATNLVHTWTANLGTFDDQGSATPTYTAPSPVDNDTTDVITHTVQGAHNKSSTDRAEVSIQAATFGITVNNVDDIDAGNTVSLASTPTGTAFGPITYQWAAVLGSFDDAASATPTYTSPAADRNMVETITLRATRQGKTSVDIESFTLGVSLFAHMSRVPQPLERGILQYR